jgi:transcription elongation factor Elf1
MYMGGKDWDTFDINDFEIYRVKVDEEDQKIKVFCIGKIKRKDSYSSYSNTSSSSYDDDKKLSESFNNISSHRDFPSNINIIAKTKGMGNDLEGITEDWNDNLDRTSSTSNQSSHQESKKSRKRRLKKIKHRDDWEYTDRKVKCESCGRYCHNVSLFEDDKGKKHNTYWCDTCILETDSIVEEGMNNVPFTNLELEQIDEWGIDISNGGYEQNYFDDRKFLTSDMTREERENIVRGIIWNQSKKDVKAKVEIKKFDDFSRIGITPEKVFVEEIEGDGGEIPREKSEIPSITEKVQEWEKEALEREKEEEAKKEIEQSKNISEIEIGDDLNKKVSELTREYPLGVG